MRALLGPDLQDPGDGPLPSPPPSPHLLPLFLPSGPPLPPGSRAWPTLLLPRSMLTVLALRALHLGIWAQYRLKAAGRDKDNEP